MHVEVLQVQLLPLQMFPARTTGPAKRQHQIIKTAVRQEMASEVLSEGGKLLPLWRQW